MNIDLLQSTLSYIIQAPYFWLTMGMVTAVSMFIGAIIFDGDMSIASKAMIGLGSYVFFLIQTQTIRISDALADKTINHSPPYMWHAANVTIFIVSLFWIFGVLLGVFISSRVHRK